MNTYIIHFTNGETLTINSGLYIEGEFAERVLAGKYVLDCCDNLYRFNVDKVMFVSESEYIED